MIERRRERQRDLADDLRPEVQRQVGDVEEVRESREGVGGALLTPGSLALISSSFAERDRPRAIGAWSGLAGIVS